MLDEAHILDYHAIKMILSSEEVTEDFVTYRFVGKYLILVSARPLEVKLHLPDGREQPIPPRKLMISGVFYAYYIRVPSMNARIEIDGDVFRIEGNDLVPEEQKMVEELPQARTPAPVAGVFTVAGIPIKLGEGKQSQEGSQAEEESRGGSGGEETGEEATEEEVELEVEEEKEEGEGDKKQGDPPVVTVTSILQTLYPVEGNIEAGIAMERKYSLAMKRRGFRKLKIRAILKPYNVVLVGEMDFVKVDLRRKRAVIVDFKSYQPKGDLLERARLQLSIYAFLLSARYGIPYENIECEVHYPAGDRVVSRKIEKLSKEHVIAIIREFAKASRG